MQLAQLLGIFMILVLVSAGILFVVKDLSARSSALESVHVAGSFQTRLGCPKDWEPDCPQTQLHYRSRDDVWQGVADYGLPVLGFLPLITMCERSGGSQLPEVAGTVRPTSGSLKKID